MDETLRPYEPSDLPAVTRIWQEVGWIDDSERKVQALADVVSYGAARVGVVAGSAECMVHRTPGRVRYEQEDLPLTAITAVTTSLVGRNLGLASRLTAQVIADGAEAGAAVAALGMFEQGFYDRLGMGTLGYTHQLRIDPARLRVARPTRRAVRLARSDWAELAGLHARRRRGHGSVALDPPEVLKAELGFVDDPMVGLGFRAEDGRLTGALVGSTTGEHGPLKVEHLAYETTTDLLDLLGLLRSLSDQVQQVVLTEPAGIQLQDLLDHPIRGADLFEPERRPWHEAMAWYQARILDLEACVRARTWPGPPVELDLTLTDPLSDGPHAPSGGWRGVAGDWSLTVGAPSSVRRGHRGGRPVLRAGVGAFTRLWFGVRPATGLAVTADLDAPPELLQALDRALCLPPPNPELAF